MLTLKRHLLTNRVIYCQSVADLSGANLSEADLSWADLSKADLSEADLSGADLSGADLSWADLSEADLSEADLSEADLSEAELSWADLSWANLSEAELSWADLSWDDLSEADLSGTCLDPNATWVYPQLDEILAAGLTTDGEYIYGYRTPQSQHCGNTTYTPGEHKAPYFSVDTQTACHPGIYFASREWLRGAGYHDKIVRCRARIDETVHAGDKWRAKRIWVFNEENDEWKN